MPRIASSPFCTLLGLWVLLFSALSAPAETLSPQEREALLKQLAEARDRTQDQQNSYLEKALQAFRRASVDPDAAYEFYLQCSEEVLFQRQNRSAQDFREWKRQQRERHDTPAFREALRHQLAWLVLYLEAEHEPENERQVAARALNQVRALQKDLELLAPSKGVLGTDVTGCLFSRCYRLQFQKKSSFPKSPLDLAGLFEKQLLPPLRRAGNTEGLRQAWLERIRLEGERLEVWSALDADLTPSRVREERRGGRPKPPQKKGEDSAAAYENWLERVRPQLLWKMEVDLYKAGDQRRAAENLMALILQHANLPQAEKWITEFEGLLGSPE